MSPKPFTPKERAFVRKKLLEAAQHSLATTGIRKTSVEALSRYAGISKGAFYLFYKSKELLFLDALEEEQRVIHDTIIREIGRYPSRRAGFVSVLSEMYKDFVTKPWLVALSTDEYEILLRKLPQQRIDSHIALDDASTRRMLSEIAQDSDIDPQLLSALLRLLFMGVLHRKEIGPYADDAFEYLLKAIAARLFPEDRI